MYTGRSHRVLLPLLEGGPLLFGGQVVHFFGQPQEQSSGGVAPGQVVTGLEKFHGGPEQDPVGPAVSHHVHHLPEDGGGVGLHFPQEPDDQLRLGPVLVFHVGEGGIPLDGVPEFGGYGRVLHSSGARGEKAAS